MGSPPEVHVPAITKVGFLGLGIMGSRMAKNLVKKGYAVSVWNRKRATADALAGSGIQVASTPAELAGRVDAFCTCVADPPALRDVALGETGLIRGAREGQLFIDFSTVSAELSRELETAFAARRVDFVEAPVTGSKNGAEKGTLLIMAGALPQAFARAEPLFQAVGEKWIHCGPVGAGTQVKLAGNALIALMLQGLSEGMLLARKAGVDPRKVLEVVQASGFRSPYYDFKGKAVLERDFETHFSIDLMFKDLGLFLDSAAKHRVPTPATAAVREAYQLARAVGLGGKDIAAVIAPFEELTGTVIGSPLGQ
jgi:3-hydroxyisobutyrate dehydrogenase-like beta-hydroxyacid dehydrogenase